MEVVEEVEATSLAGEEEEEVVVVVGTLLIVVPVAVATRDQSISVYVTMIWNKMNVLLYGSILCYVRVPLFAGIKLHIKKRFLFCHFNSMWSVETVHTAQYM